MNETSGDQTPKEQTPLALTAIELEQLEKSPLGLATVVGTAEMTLLVNTPAGIFLRRIPSAIPLRGDRQRGDAAEWITRTVAAAWGLPDFVFRPRKVAKGAATRELGDGTILVGSHGLALQSKSRAAVELRYESGERSWLLKNITRAAKQAAGTVRSIRQQPTELVNGRRRAIFVDGNDYDWTGVVLIDHPSVPEEVIPPTFSGSLPIVTLLRKDWEFLFDQLRSVYAVTRYLRRVVVDGYSVALGQEPVRYYELAQLDEEAVSSADPLPPPPISGRRESLPLLPKPPAGNDDQTAHDLYRVLLEDIATSPLDDGREEYERLGILAELDRLEVGARTELGQHLIARLEDVARTPPAGVAIHHRRFFFEEGRQLNFSVASRLDDGVRAIFMCWVQLRHHELQVTTGVVDDSVTVAVLITPRPDGVRHWDTTLLAVRGDLAPMFHDTAGSGCRVGSPARAADFAAGV